VGAASRLAVRVQTRRQKLAVALYRSERWAVRATAHLSPSERGKLYELGREIVRTLRNTKGEWRRRVR